MRESKVLVFLKFTGIFLSYQWGFIEAFVGGLTECIEYQKLGCFFDDLSDPRPLPKLLENYRGTFNWSNMQQTINSKTSSCAEAASRNSFTVFGLQYYGECWSGVNAAHTYAEDGRSTRCMMAISNMVLKECNDSSPEPCVGIQYTNYVYRIVDTVDGNFTSWSSWNQCSKTCGTGYQRRTRSCTNPPPSRCGKSCKGGDEEFLECNSQSCPTPEPCENNHKDCDTYEKLGLCTDSYPDVLRRCKKSCGRCR